jgi:hypothetical protein
MRKQKKMKPKTREDIAAEIKKLKAQDKQLVNDKKLAYATGIAKAIKAGHLNATDINNALEKVVKSKKDRALLGLTDADTSPSQAAPSASTGSAYPSKG